MKTPISKTFVNSLNLRHKNSGPDIKYFSLNHLLFKKAVLTFLILIVCYNSYSQENTSFSFKTVSNVDQGTSDLKLNTDTNSFRLSGSHIFSISSGYSRHLERDDAISPFVYRGFTIPVEFSYRYQGNKNRIAFTFFFDHLTLKSVLPGYSVSGPQYSTINTNLSIETFYTRKFFSLPEHKLDICFGGGLHLLLNYRLHNSGYSNIGNKYTMLDQLNSIAFMFQAEKRYAANGQMLSFDLFIPAISYVLPVDTYNAYVGKAIDKLINYDGNVLIKTLQNGEWASFNKLICINANLSYTRFVGSHFGFELKYGFQYYKFTQYSDLNYSKNLQNDFIIGLRFKL